VGEFRSSSEDMGEVKPSIREESGGANKGKANAGGRPSYVKSLGEIIVRWSRSRFDFRAIDEFPSE
jgi:hypothetical protein